MSSVKRAREEAGGGDAAGGGGGGAGAAAPFATLTQVDVLLSLGIVAQTLSRRLLTAEDDAAAARAASAAWAARPPRPDDDEGCLARARRSAELAAVHAERVAAEAPRLLRTFGARVSGLCRDTWTCVPPGLSAADADRVRAQHPIWRAIISHIYGGLGLTRLHWAASKGRSRACASCATGVRISTTEICVDRRRCIMPARRMAPAQCANCFTAMHTAKAT